MTKEQKEARKRADVLIEEMLAEHGIGREAVLGRNGLVARLTQRVVEKALAGELTHHLGYHQGRRATAGKLSQREQRQDGLDGGRADGDCGAAGSVGEF